MAGEPDNEVIVAVRVATGEDVAAVADPPFVHFDRVLAVGHSLQLDNRAEAPEEPLVLLRLHKEAYRRGEQRAQHEPDAGVATEAVDVEVVGVHAGTAPEEAQQPRERKAGPVSGRANEELAPPVQRRRRQQPQQVDELLSEDLGLPRQLRSPGAPQARGPDAWPSVAGQLGVDPIVVEPTPFAHNEHEVHGPTQ
jgi:hypothetical protein